jgi:hypothetical protein
MRDEVRFGVLRSILQRAPSVETWQALVDHLGTWPDEPRERLALPYASQLLARWPDTVAREPLSWWLPTIGTPYEAPMLRLINTFTMGQDSFDDARLAALLSWRGTSPLRTLRLPLAGLTDERAAQIAAAPSLAGLRRLDAAGNALTTTGALALVSSSNLPQLNAISLAYIALGDACAIELAATPALSRLTNLNLTQTGITDIGALALAASPHVAGLSALHLYDNPLTDAGAAALASSPYLHDSIRAQWRR